MILRRDEFQRKRKSGRAILGRGVREETRKKFAVELGKPVRLLYFVPGPGRGISSAGTEGREAGFLAEIRRLLEEVAALSDRLSLTEYDLRSDPDKAAEFGIDEVPAIAILGEKDSGIRFFGIPSGFEYRCLIEAVIDVSRETTALSPAVKNALKAIDRPVRIRVFVTPNCALCPAAVRLGHQFALESPWIAAEMIESDEFPDIADRYEVRGVPKIVLNDVFSFEGSVSEDIFLENIRKALSAEGRPG